MIDASPNFWMNKKVLLTGHTGFKGGWMALWLSKMGAKVTGIGLAPNSNPNLFELAGIEGFVDSYILDIRDQEAVFNIVKKVKPEIILHFAAQSLVRVGYQDPITTFDTNVVGTVNVLDAVRAVDSVRVVVAATTDKVYKNLGTRRAYKETDQLGGFDPYSASKAASEFVVASYRDSYFIDKGIAIASVRAGNVIGGGDWSKDLLIPDAIRAWSANLPLEIRRPTSIRPWQHVLEPLNGYLVLAQRLYANLSLSGPYNFGPEIDDSVAVREVIELASQIYGYGKVLWGDGAKGPHEADLLFLDASKVTEVLGVSPRFTLKEAIERTMSWYYNFASGSKAYELCQSDIAFFSEKRAN